MSEHSARIDTPAGLPTWGGDFDHAIDAFAAAVMRARSVDPVITELVRLRCAQYHDCRLCGSLRLDEAAEQGVDETMVAKIARYEDSDLNDAAKAALRLADAMIIRPAAADAKLRAELLEHFTEGQIAEICLDVVKWSQQKYLVALRVETPPWSGLGVLGFDEGGNPQIRDTV
jgi:hypothetical protein